MKEIKGRTDGVVTLNFKMPSSCNHCPLCVDGKCIIVNKTKPAPSDKRHSDCPLKTEENIASRTLHYARLEKKIKERIGLLEVEGMEEKVRLRRESAKRLLEKKATASEDLDKLEEEKWELERMLSNLNRSVDKRRVEVLKEMRQSVDSKLVKNLLKCLILAIEEYHQDEY